MQDNIEQALDDLLDAMEQNKLSEFSDEYLVKNENKLKEYVHKNASEFNLNQITDQDDRVDKATVLQMISETYYRVQSLTIELNRLNVKMHQLLEMKKEDTTEMKHDLTPTSIESASRALFDLRNSSLEIKSETTADVVFGKLHVDIVEALFRLRFTIVTDCKVILDKTNPIDMGYLPHKVVTLQQSLSIHIHIYVQIYT
ncbi:hypothetical protein RFI_07974 [Reticulomyxa filosa]|uniref:Uncharacterized protein n=1 Tax=Reticulomyxa filosa TaxID=46433 RepID=X6NT05_RETFI|nr:hypothetical protein RFI_07974 [Reticulomyxa filosa]|eukprot:ETO29151.1 hypothetical protein RFI_07974 [Reticulomyxa filosa]